MRIAVLDWYSYGNQDIIDAFNELGHEVIKVKADEEKGRSDAKEVNRLKEAFEQANADLVFSFNYWPAVSLAAKEFDLVYISWVYDSPHVVMYSYTTIYPKNYIFCFDKQTVEEFRRGGINTVYYLPLAANPNRLSKLTDFDMFNATKWANKKDISFVGSLYTTTNGDNPFFKRLEGINDYTRGYLDGLMQSQRKVYGYNFIQSMLPTDIIDEMRKFLPMTPNPEGIETVEYLFAQYVINRQITHLDRMEIINRVSEKFGMDLYTRDEDFSLKGLVNHGRIDNYSMAPYVFKKSKINFNITLRSILSGIPLRAFEIMGAGGFLLTNYQPDFDDCFIAGEDYVFYESVDDMMNKIEYYLVHEDERKQIAENGLNRIRDNHTYLHRVKEMLNNIET